MTGPTFSGTQPTISVHLNRIVTVGGLKVRVELEPGCWVGGGRLGLMASHRIAGGARLKSRRRFDRATPADLDAMIRRLRLVRCRFPGCRNPNLIGDGREPGNAKGYCERHRLQDIVAAAAKLQAKIDAERVRSDAAQFRNGFRYKATVWIHRDDGDDTAVVLYFTDKPTNARVRREAVRRRSRLPDDFRIELLRPVADGKGNRK